MLFVSCAPSLKRRQHVHSPASTGAMVAVTIVVALCLHGCGEEDGETSGGFLMSTNESQSETASQDHFSTSCVDSPTYFQGGATHKGCPWVAQNPGARCNLCYQGHCARYECAQTCGTCGWNSNPCADDPNYTDQGETCDWVAENPSARCRRCNPATGTCGRYGCRATCGTCQSMPPTPSPTPEEAPVPTPAPSATEAETQNEKFKRMKGLICADQLCLDTFADSVSWHYTYKLALADANGNPELDKIAKLNAEGVEWVPLVSGPFEWLTAAGEPCNWLPEDGCSYDGVDACTAEGTYNRVPWTNKNWGPYVAQCNKDTLVDTISMTQNALNEQSKAKYLMMFNEGYLSCNNAQCRRGWMHPTHLVEVWRKYFIPAAKELGLDLVSPTFKGDVAKYQDWAADVLAQCYRLRDDPEFPCDIFSIKKFSVHAYHCSEQFFTDYYAKDGRFFWKTDLKLRIRGLLGDEYNDAEFTTFFDERKVWLTEFSCAADGTYRRYPNGFRDPYPYGSAPYSDQCRRASGQVPESHGMGVYKALSSNDEFERFSWFGLVVGCDFGDTYVGSGNNVITAEGVLTPPGTMLKADYTELAGLSCEMPDVTIECDGSGDGSENPDQD